MADVEVRELIGSESTQSAIKIELLSGQRTNDEFFHFCENIKTLDTQRQVHISGSIQNAVSGKH